MKKRIKDSMKPLKTSAEMDQKIMNELQRKSRGRTYWKSAAAAACLLLAVLVVTQRQTVVLYAKELQSAFEKYILKTQNVDLKQSEKIKTSKKVKTKNGITVEVEKMAVSDGQAVLLYSIETKDAVNLYKKDQLNVGTIFRDGTNQAEDAETVDLFKEDFGGSIDCSVWQDTNESLTDSPNKIYFYETYAGRDFKYLKKPLDLEIQVVDAKQKLSKFQFDLQIDHLNQSEEKKIDKVYTEDGLKIQITKMVVDIAEIRIEGTYSKEKKYRKDGYDIVLKDQNGKRIYSNESEREDKDGGKFIYHFYSLKDMKNVKIQVLKGHKEVVKTISIE